jgi:mono/diheme cytochrome c family protein
MHFGAAHPRGARAQRPSGAAPGGVALQKRKCDMGGNTMRHLRIAPIVIAAFAATGAAADALSDQQRLGQSLFVQSCGVCHLKPQLTAVQFAPVLSQDSASGNEAAMRQVIANGTPRMPGFRYQFSETQIAAIAAYLKTVPVPAAAASAPAARREGRDAD